MSIEISDPNLQIYETRLVCAKKLHGLSNLMVKHWISSGLLGILLCMGIEAACGWCYYSYWVWKSKRKHEKIKEEIAEERKSRRRRESKVREQVDSDYAASPPNEDEIGAPASVLVLETGEILREEKRISMEFVASPIGESPIGKEDSIQSRFLSVTDLIDRPLDGEVDEDQEFRVPSDLRCRSYRKNE
jgi:hypothetical protein